MNTEFNSTTQRQWYVVYSKPQKEEYAKLHLSSKGLEVFFPRLLLPESNKQRRKIVPLFPNYLFVRLNLLSDEYYWASWSPGVSRIINFNGHPTSIEDNIIDLLKMKADGLGIIPARSNLKVGQEVRITDGPLEGLLGIIQEPPTAKGRVKILLQLLNRQTNVEVPVHFVNANWVASGVGLPVEP
jgi:transcriptional antiterminator RfaH